MKIYRMIQLSLERLPAYLFPIMEFKDGELVERELEIAGYLLHKFSLNQMAIKTGLSKRILMAHLRNMMEKFKAININDLIRLIKKR